jgi:hypothetical protein
MLLSDRRGQVTPLDALSRILRTRCLFASARTSNQSHPVVCFSSRPLADILKQRCYRPHLHRWDYEPYGIAIRRSAAIDAGLQPVIYGTEQQRKNLPAEDQYRFQSCGKTYDWTGEAEWRCHGDLRLDEFRPNDLRLFVANRDDALKLNTELPISIVGELLEPNARLKALAAWSGITIRS